MLSNWNTTWPCRNHVRLVSLSIPLNLSGMCDHLAKPARRQMLDCIGIVHDVGCRSSRMPSKKVAGVISDMSLRRRHRS